MNNFDELTETKYIPINDETNWKWIKKDTGAWDGPKVDWEDHHSKKYFKYLNGIDTVITAGANQGMYARFYSKIFKNVYAFEPDPLCFHCLVNNCQAKNVIKIQAALGCFNGFAGVKDYTILNEEGDINTGATRIVDSGNIPILTIDSLNLHGVDLIQLDVEEYEYNVILGAISTIEKFKPIIIVETVTIDLYLLLNYLNYSIIDISASDKIYAHASHVLFQAVK